MIDGIDVAYPQYVINWKALADAGNISFVSAKVTQVYLELINNFIITGKVLWIMVL